MTSDRTLFTGTLAAALTSAAMLVAPQIACAHGETASLVPQSVRTLPNDFHVRTQQLLSEQEVPMHGVAAVEDNQPCASRVRPRKTGEELSPRDRAGEIDYTCLIAGRYRATATRECSAAAESATETKC